jgi:hypothetical protein
MVYIACYAVYRAPAGHLQPGHTILHAMVKTCSVGFSGFEISQCLAIIHYAITSYKLQLLPCKLPLLALQLGAHRSDMICLLEAFYDRFAKLSNKLLHNP